MSVKLVALVVGVGLIVFPEPATTAAGIMITVAALGLEDDVDNAAAGGA